MGSRSDQTAGSDCATLVELLRLRAHRQGDQRAYTFLDNGEAEGASFTYAELDRRARTIAAGLRVVGDAQRAVLLYPPGLEYIAAFFGCLYAGVAAVPAYPPDPARLDRTVPRLRALLRDVDAGVVLCTSEIAQAADALAEYAPEIRGLRWLATDGLDVSAASTFRAPRCDGRTLAAIQYTSGSTSSPRGVNLSHENLLHNLSLIQVAFGLVPASVGVIWLPPYHDMGLIGGVLEPLFTGFPVVLMSPIAFLQRPLRWLEAVTRYGATVSGGPNFAYDLCIRKSTAAERAGLALGTWNVAFSGAEPVRADTVERFSEAFAPAGFRRRAFYPCYGLAEATLIVSGGSVDADPVVRGFDTAALAAGRAEAPRSEDRSARLLVGCGRQRPGQSVCIVDPTTRAPCPPGQVGEIWVAGPSVAAGYWAREEDTEEVFHAVIRGREGQHFLRTGDLGFVLDEELFVTGRIKALILVRGRNVYAQDIERTTERAHPALRPGGSAAFAVATGGEEQLVVVAELGARPGAATGAAVAAAVRQAIVGEHDVEPAVVLLVTAGAVPKTSSGKVQRFACRDAFLAGTLPALFDSREAAIHVAAHAQPQPEEEPLPPRPASFRDEQAAVAWLVPRVARILGVASGSLDPHRPIAEHGLDSLRSVELQHELERSAGVVVSLEELLCGPSVADLAARLRSAPQAASTPSGAADARGAGDASERPASFEALSDGQRALWFLQELAPRSTAYSLARAMRIDEALDAGALRTGLQRLVDRHAALRTSFPRGDAGEPVQRVAARAEICFAHHDIATWAPAELTARLDDEAARPFDLARGPLFRVSLFTRGPREHVLLLALHHIVTDLWSLAVLVEELGMLYAAALRGEPAALPPPGLPYVDYVREQAGRLSGPEGERLWRYWAGALTGELAALELPSDRPRPRVPTARGAATSRVLCPELTAKVRELARAEGVSPFVVLLSAFYATLERHSGQTDLIVGTPAAGRTAAGFSRTLGYFANILPLRADLTKAPTFAALLAQTRTTVTEALMHQAMPFPRIVERLARAREAGRAPIVQVTFAVPQTPTRRAGGLAALVPGGAAAEVDLGWLRVMSIDLPPATARFDLALEIVESGDGLRAALEYDPDLFDHATAAGLLGRYATLLAGAVAAPHDPLASLPLLTESARRVLVEQVRAHRPVTATLTAVHEAVALRAAATPHAIALIEGDERLTCGALEAASSRLAHHLRAHGVVAEMRVGVCLERGVDLIVALLAVLKAGGAYVPLDPEQPTPRLAQMAGDAELSVLVTVDSQATRLGGAFASRVVRLDADRTAIAACSTAPLTARGAPTSLDTLAYVLYTSGSSGRPKGVMVSHRALATHMQWMAGAFPLERSDVVLQKTPFGFDASVWEIFAPLLSSARLALAPRGAHRDPTAIAEAVIRSGATTLQLVPTMLRALLSARLLGPCLSLRRVFSGGEALTADDRTRFEAECPGVTLVNLYGPTETTIDATFWVCDDASDPRARVPIGRPVDGMRAHVLDAAGGPVPAGVAGELYLGGAQLARGYVGRPMETAAAFVPDPFGDSIGARLYRTGDLARTRSDGVLEFLGRRDQQIKLRGVRIELGEVEAVLGSHEAVAEVVAVVAPDGIDRQLVAYVVPRAGMPRPTPAELRQHVGRQLPASMIPSAYVQLPAFPLTASGKIDRAALPNPTSEARASREFRAPATDLERAVAGVFASVLSLPPERVGADDDFFDRGGHSLLATQLVSRIRSELGITIPLRAVFEAPTVMALAAHLAQTGAQRTEEAPPLRPRPPGDAEVPLSFGQERLWFLDQLLGAERGGVYTVPGVARLGGALDVVAFERALGDLVARHEALRTRFASSAGRPVQRIDAPRALPLELVDLEGLPEASREPEARKLAVAAAARPFDLARGPLVRAALLRLAPSEHWLVLTLHHIVCDAWSIGVMVRELSELYAARLSGATSTLPPPRLQFADYAVWQRSWLQGEALERQLAYWREALAGAPPALELPTDRARGREQTFRGAQVSFTLPAALFASIETVSRREGVTPFMTLLAAFAALLGAYSGQTDVLVATPIANRTRLETEDVLGFFANTLVLRTDLEGDPTFAALLARVRQATLAAYAHQDAPFESLVDALASRRHVGRAPLVQVAFALQNTPLPLTAIGPVSLTPVRLEASTAKFDLTLFLEPSHEGHTAVLEYNSDLFDGATAARMLGHYCAILESACADTTRQLSALRLIDDREERALLARCGGRTTHFAPGATLHELFEQKASLAPDRVAVVLGPSRVTYGELDRRADVLARRLRDLGVGAESIVALCAERSIELVVGMLAVLKAGGAYLPLDPEHPPERIAFVMEDAGAAVVLVERAHAAKLPDDGRPRLWLDEPAQGERVPDNKGSPTDSAGPRAERPTCRTNPAGLAYVIYTSGSTGRPKGVGVTHHNLVRLFQATEALYGFDADDVWTLFHSPAFDFSVWEIWGALLHGASLVVVPHRVSRAPEALRDLLVRERVTVLNQTPSAFRLLAEHEQTLPAGADDLDLRWVIFGGEALDFRELVPWLGRHPKRPRLVNMYGITETTVHVTERPIDGADVQPGSRNSIGRPLADLGVYVLDRQGLPVASGMVGEIYVGGAGVARGYIGRPALTAARFLPDPFAGESGARMYRSGDLARRRADAELEYLGRADQQVKLRGFRIETGEIESVLAQHPGVRSSLVALREYAPGDERLVAYLVPDPTTAGPALRLAKLEREGRAAGKPLHELPNGMAVLERNAGETTFLYREIFDDEGYLRHGVAVRDGDVVFDVGANIGMFALCASRAARDVTVYAIEPIPPICELLRLNAEIHGMRGCVLQCGLGGEATTAVFTYYPHNSVLSGRFADPARERDVVTTLLRNETARAGGAALSEGALEELAGARLAAERFDCPVRTLSEVLREAGVVRIDLLKIDVEKAEWDVLQGIEDQDWPKIRQVVVEVHDQDGRLQRTTELLEARGLSCTVEQDPLLAGTALYSIFAVRPGGPVAATTPSHPAYAGPARLIADVRAFATARLPEYMVPAAMVTLDELPLTSSGKLDRRRLPPLPRVVREGTRGAEASPRTDAERTIVAVWEAVLGVTGIGVRDSFFELGGNSLLLVRVRDRLAEVFGREIPVTEMFNHPTVSALADYLRGDAGTAALDEAAARARARQGSMRQSAARRRR